MYLLDYNHSQMFLLILSEKKGKLIMSVNDYQFEKE
jgi:hypothetical protein